MARVRPRIRKPHLLKPGLRTYKPEDGSKGKRTCSLTGRNKSDFGNTQRGHCHSQGTRGGQPLSIEAGYWEGGRKISSLHCTTI